MFEFRKTRREGGRDVFLAIAKVFEFPNNKASTDWLSRSRARHIRSPQTERKVDKKIIIEWKVINIPRGLADASAAAAGYP